MNRWSLVVLAVCLAAGCRTPAPVAAPAPEPTTAPTPATTSAERPIVANYDVPTPPGFELFRHVIVANLYAAGGRAFLQTQTASIADAFRGSILISPLSTPPAFDPAADNACRSLYERASEAASAPVVTPEQVDLAAGRTCRFALHKPDWEHRAAQAYFMPSRVQSWLVTCAFDKRDDVAKSGCETVLAGWVFR